MEDYSQYLEFLSDVDKKRVLQDQLKVNTFRILRGNTDSLFYAFQNGILIHDDGEKSYRSALRKNIIPRLIDISKEGEISTLIYFDELRKDASIEITLKNLNEFISEYTYQGIIDKYGKSKKSYDIHLAIDDWNQLPNTSKDLIKINPHDIKISKDHDITIQELKETEFWYFSPVTYRSHYFLNGMPLETFKAYERIIHNGLVIGEKEADKDIDQIDIIICSILEDDKEHSYKVIEEGTTLSDKIEKTLTLCKVYKK